MDTEDLYRAGEAAWPKIRLARDAFAAAIARHGSPANVERASDLYIAVASVEGNPRAIEAVRTMLASELHFAATKTTATADQISEAQARLSHVLFVDEPQRAAALRGYSGRGELVAYLRVVARRELFRIVNQGRREVGLDADIIDCIVPPKDPEISLLRERYRDEVDRGLRIAVGRLDDRERALLRYAFVEGLNVDAVGKLYGVHRATAARWIAVARERLGTAIREQLAEQLAIELAEVDSIVRLVQSRIDASLDRVLSA
jgi:RNA polymerase sigma-70 factor, ECF subfamily